MSPASSVSSPRGPIAPGRQAGLDIRFCSVCNESIPDGEFDAGRAVTANGRSQHVACALERAARVGSPRTWWTSALALYAAAVTTFLLVAWLGRDRESGDAAAVPAATETRIDEATRASEARVVRLVEERLDALPRDLRDKEIAPLLSSASTTLREELQALETRTSGSAALLDERIAAVAKRQDGVENQVTLLTQWHDAIQRQADALDAGLRRLADQPAEAPVEAVPAQPAAPDVETPPAVDPGRAEEIAGWIAKLRGKDGDLVFAAASQLGRLRALEAVGPLIEVLTTHADEFPRAGAAGALGEMRACDAVPALIEALMDKDSLVQAASGDAVEKITEHRFDFSIGLSQRDRKKIQTAMRAWWKENEDAVRAKQGQPKTP